MPAWLSQIGRIRAPIPPALYWTVAAATFALPAAIWWLASSGGYVDRLFLPSPADVAKQAVVLAENGRLWSDIGWSVYRVFAGFTLAAIVAIPVGILMGTYHIADAIFEPITDFVRYMPAAAFIPLIMLYVGIGETAKILMIFIGTYFQLVLLVAAVARTVPIDVINVAYTLGATRRQVLTNVVVPASLPGLVENLRITLGWAWTYVIVAELIAAQQGLGFRIMEAQRFLKTDTIFLYIAIIGILGLASDQIMRRISSKTMPWAETFHR
ncbi:ABC transporter permease [Hyphomicrobium sp. 99]|uniref:ABC transporter permease n=1 Tax=Hyphomicrobium sp. 99 TaxID=1163419 RepID=UPI0005F859BE|nr:ABC transporter permease [Hyphomicrobium sp. 99]